MRKVFHLFLIAFSIINTSFQTKERCANLYKQFPGGRVIMSNDIVASPVNHLLGKALIANTQYDNS